MMAETVFLADINWPEFERRIAEGAVVFIPLGATGVDAIIPDSDLSRSRPALSRACRAADRLWQPLAAALGRRLGLSRHDQHHGRYPFDAAARRHQSCSAMAPGELSW
jgi:hypothetical protein